MVILFVTILQNQIGAKVICRDNFVVISGNFSIEPQSEKSINFNYPNGFTKDNCITISCSIDFPPYGTNFIGYYQDSGDFINNAYKRTLTFKNDSIYFEVENPLTGRTLDIKYKIVLLKLPDVAINGFETGDVNMDGEITLEDAELVKKYIMGTATFTETQEKLADVNNNGEVDSSDYTIIKNMAENNA